MSLTLLYRGKNVRFQMKLNKLRWLTALASFSLISGGIVYLIMSAGEAPASSIKPFAQQKLQPITTSTDPQITALTVKLAELQSHTLRLNALGERLAEEANIPATEFNFDKAPVGGGLFSQSIADGQKSISEIIAQTQQLESELLNKEKQLKMLESLTLGHHIENTSYLSGRPIKKGWLSSYYGMRKDPFNGRPAMHKGVDFAGTEGGDIIATGAGVVTWSGERYGYGNLIEINHGKGYKTRYGHNKELLVKIGDVVSKGQQIAIMGSTGRSTGPHVHYEILKNDRQVDPARYVYRKAKQ